MKYLLQFSKGSISKSACGVNKLLTVVIASYVLQIAVPVAEAQEQEANTSGAKSETQKISLLTQSFRHWLPVRKKQEFFKMVEMESNPGISVREAYFDVAPYFTTEKGSRRYHVAKCEVVGKFNFTLYFEAAGELPKDDKEATNFLIDKIPVAILVEAYGSEDNKQIAIVKNNEDEALALSNKIAQNKSIHLLELFGAGRQWKQKKIGELLLDNGEIAAFVALGKSKIDGAASGNAKTMNCAQLIALFAKASNAADFKELFE